MRQILTDLASAGKASSQYALAMKPWGQHFYKRDGTKQPFQSLGPLTGHVWTSLIMANNDDSGCLLCIRVQSPSLLSSASGHIARVL